MPTVYILHVYLSPSGCGENEVYTNCMSPCKLQHCKDLKQMPDACDPNIKCQPGCECIQNFLRNSDNVCISSDICEEYDSQYDPEMDTDIIFNETDDAEATNEDRNVYKTVSSKDGLIKETGSNMNSNTEDEEDKDQDTEDDDQYINEIEDYQSFKDQLNNGDWVIEQTEHSDTNQEPNTDQKVSSEEEIKIGDNNKNIIEQNTPNPTSSSDQQKHSDDKSEVDTGNLTMFIVKT